MTKRSIKDRPGSAYLSIGAENTAGVAFKGTMVKVETRSWKGHGGIS
jgi:hypothetical protein